MLQLVGVEGTPESFGTSTPLNDNTFVLNNDNSLFVIADGILMRFTFEERCGHERHTRCDDQSRLSRPRVDRTTLHRFYSPGGKQISSGCK